MPPANMKIEVVRGSITDVVVDAVVTAGKSRLVGGRGVNGAVHAAAGPGLLRALRPLAPCPPGSAVVTPAFAMRNTRWVIHAVGPRYAGPRDAPVLASAYTAALARADEVGARTVAFPSISTGVYGYPEEAAARISIAALRQATTAVDKVLLVAFGRAPVEAVGGAALTPDMITALLTAPSPPWTHGCGTTAVARGGT